MNAVKNERKDEFKRSSFLTALEGIKSGRMAYQGDSILPLLQEEIAKRTAEFQNLSAEEEGKLL